MLDGCMVVMWRYVQRDPQPCKQLSVYMYIRPIWTLSCHVPSVPKPSSTLKPSDAMASGCIPLGHQTLSKVYFIILPLLSNVIPMSN